MMRWHAVRFRSALAVSDHSNQIAFVRNTRAYSATQRVKCQVERELDTRQRDWHDRKKSRDISVETETTKKS